MGMQKELQAAIKAILPEVDCVIGWGSGPDPLHGAPVFMRSEDDANRFSSGFFAVNNPALFLPEYKGKKVGVVVKGCDARSVGQLLSEGLIKREEVSLIGFPCQGVVDHDKVAAALGDKGEMGEVTAVQEEGDALVLTLRGETVRLNKAEVTAEKCLRCQYPNAHIADTFVGEKREPVATADEFADLAAFEAMSLEDRQAFWEKEMSRCIRCYACRNACPLCVCRDHCVATSRDPSWLTQADSVKDKLFFQVIHATHLAGRCTGCGECQRACPVGIPVLLLKRSLARSVEKLFAYRAGIDEGTPPLLTFTLEEPTIKERSW